MSLTPASSDRVPPGQQRVEAVVRQTAEFSLRLRLIGQMAGSNREGEVALPRTRKTRALIAILALASPQPVLRTHITGLLWSTREREQARASLRQCVHEAQAFLIGLGLREVQAGRQHLQMVPGQIWVDVLALQAATMLQPEGLGLLQGSLLEDLVGLDPAFDGWLRDHGERLRTGAATLAAQLLDHESEPGAVIAAGRRLVGLAPTHEVGWRRLIRAYLDSGERSAALEAFDQCARALLDGPGLTPSDETRALLRPTPGGGVQGGGAQGGGAPVRFGAERHMVEPPRRAGAWLGVAVFRAADLLDEAMVSVGLAEEITQALARFRWINLIAPGSIAALAHEPLGQTDRWRRLGLDFLLDGTVQRSKGARLSRAGLDGNPDGERIRVTVRLLDMRGAQSGQMVWSQRFERDAADLFSLQDDIAAETAAQVDPELIMHESRRFAGLANAPGQQAASAYELMLRAIPAIYRLVRPGYLEAGALLAEAARLAPDMAQVFSWWACWHAFLVGQGWAEAPEEAMARAGTLAERAVSLDPGCARALSIAAYVRSFVLHKDIAQTIALHERALALNPNLPFAWAVSALSLTYAGEHETAVAHAQQARRLSPFDPHGFFFDNTLMVPSLMLGDYETVVAVGQRALGLNPSMSSTCKGLLSALGHLGRVGEALELRERLLVLEPGFTLRKAAARSALRRRVDLEIYVDGLRKAGLAEGV
jgi:DNA-binding SARP family transcriptional activator/TolB-like protein